MQKKYFRYLILLLMILLLGAIFFFLAEKALSAAFSIENPLGENSDINTLVMKVIDFLILLAIPLTAILIVYSGYNYITSAGNDKKIQAAQKTLIWALIGFAIVLLAKGVPALIAQFLAGE